MIRIDHEGLSIVLRGLEFILGAPVSEGGEARSLRVITKGIASSEFNFRATFCSGKVIFFKLSPPFEKPPSTTHNVSKDSRFDLQKHLQGDPSISAPESLHMDTYTVPTRLSSPPRIKFIDHRDKVK